MDSFTMLFTAALSPYEMRDALRKADFDACVLSTGAVGVCFGPAYVWLDLIRSEDLSPADCEDKVQWPIPHERVALMATVTVRRNVESERLAVKLAHELVGEFEASILWDGMDQWEELYRIYAPRSDLPGSSPVTPHIGH